MWNPFESIKKKLSGETAAPEGADAASDAGFKELEKKGLMPQFFRHWKNPAFLKQLKGIVGRMQAEGVNVKDKAAVESWLKTHQAEIEAGTLSEAPTGTKTQPFVKTGPQIGRNDPCHCGSGKKFKKCCAVKAA